LRWFCVPIRHTLRAKGRSHWLTWDEREKAVWAREMPAWAITGVEGLDESSSYRDVIKSYYFNTRKISPIVCVTGIRIEEAINRKRGIIQAGTYVHHEGRYIYGKPLFDWKTRDVWKAILEFNWSHSRYYDRMWLKQQGLLQQRVAPWGNVANNRHLPFYAEFYPDFWEKAIRRLPELRAVARYGQSPLYREILSKPLGMSWQAYAIQILNRLELADRQVWIHEIQRYLNRWARRSTSPFPEELEGGDPGPCWKRIAMIMAKNDRIKGGNRDAT